MELRFEIGGGLGGKRWIAWSDTCAVFSMATGTWFETALRIALLIQPGSSAILVLRHTAGIDRDRQIGIVTRDLLASGPVQMVCDPGHLVVPPLPCGEIIKLPDEVTRIESGKPGCKIAVSLPSESVTGDTGSHCPGIGT